MSFRLLNLSTVSCFLCALGCGDDSSSSTTTGGGGAGAGGAAGDSASGGTASGGDASGGSSSAGDSAGGMMSGGAGGAGGGGDAGAAGAGGSQHGTAMSFFVSSVPPSTTGDLGGLDGADQHCADLAMAAGAVRTQWVAYLSVAAPTQVDARDRIGEGPWYNADEDVFAENQAALHELPTIMQGDIDSRNTYIAAKPADELFMDENGDPVPGGVHDVLTGSNPDGTLDAGNTCQDWTSDSNGDSRTVGHSDTPGNTQFSPSWNAAHTNPGCDTNSIDQTGGEGRIYCFALD